MKPGDLSLALSKRVSGGMWRLNRLCIQPQLALELQNLLGTKKSGKN
jgi:hypothetical protein